MKKPFALYGICSVILLSISLYGEVKTNTGDERNFYPESTSNANITSAVLNGKPAFFKTYQDFLNGTGQPWIYKYDDLVYSKGAIKAYNLVFKNESGKEEKIASTMLWGWRNEYGEVYRMGDFVFQGVTKTPFQREYVANDHIYYSPKSVGARNAEQQQWCSENLNSAIVGKDDYFNNHSKESYDKIRHADKDCQTKIPAKRSFATDIKALAAYNQQISQCRLAAGELICIWTTTSWNKMRTDGYGSYFFNKK